MPDDHAQDPTQPPPRLDIPLSGLSPEEYYVLCHTLVADPTMQRHAREADLPLSRVEQIKIFRVGLEELKQRATPAGPIVDVSRAADGEESITIHFERFRLTYEWQVVPRAHFDA